MPRPSSPGAIAGVKPVLTGAIDRTGMPPSAYQSVVHAYVVEVYWSQIQPTAWGPVLRNNSIDRAIAAVRSFNQSQPGTPIRLKVRVGAGVNAPNWTKSLAGTVTLTNTFNGKVGTVPRFWLPAYAQAYADLQNKLAALYDSVPEIAETVVSGCSSFYPEEYLRDTTLASNVQAYLAAGYTLGADQLCHRAEIDAHKVWIKTRSGVAFNPFQEIHSNGTVSFDEPYTEQMMAYCRSNLGNRCSLENDSLRTPVAGIGPLYPRMYSVMGALGGPVSIQTAVAQRVGDLNQAIAYAIMTARARSVELPDGYSSMLSTTALAGFDNQMTGL